MERGLGLLPLTTRGGLQGLIREGWAHGTFWFLSLLPAPSSFAFSLSEAKTSLRGWDMAYPYLTDTGDKNLVITKCSLKPET